MPKNPFKKQKKEQEKRQAKIEAFHKEYKELSEKYGLDFHAILESSPGGLYPRIIIQDKINGNPTV